MYMYMYVLSTLRRHEEIDTLQCIKKELILTILDPLPPPTDLTRYLTRDLLLLFNRLKEK